jgi:hypothetical protein
MEGNQMPRMSDDDTFGTHNLNTFFRNNFNCYDPPWTGGADYQALSFGAYARFENVIGNTLGSLDSAGNPICPAYSSTNSPYLLAINLGGGDNNPFDNLTPLTLLRWGNYAICAGDSHCNNVSNFDSKENPTSLTGAATAYNNLLSPSTTLPASFFVSGNTPSWFSVCTTWGAFPSSCSATQTAPFPAIGPDVTNGRADSAGHANDIPAAVLQESAHRPCLSEIIYSYRLKLVRRDRNPNGFRIFRRAGRHPTDGSKYSLHSEKWIIFYRQQR